jgi:hypothetical protein
MDLTPEIHSDILHFTSSIFHPFLLSHHVLLSTVSSSLTTSTQSFKEDVSALTQEKERFIQLKTEQEKQAAEEVEKVRELEKNYSQLEIHASLLPTQIERMKATQRINDSKNQSLKQEVDSLTTSKLREIDAVTRGVFFFQSRLGVDFSVEGGKLKISFKKIKQDEEEKEYACWIFVDENKEYQLHSCIPSLPSIDSLINELNTSNHFASFIQAVRREFVALARQ